MTEARAQGMRGWSRRLVLRQLLWLGGMAVTAVTLPARFWRRVGPAADVVGSVGDVSRRHGVARVAAMARRARPFDQHTLDKDHDLAG